MEGCIDSRKRTRDESNDSLYNFIGSKILRLDSAELNFISPDHVNDAPVVSVSSDAKSINSKQIGINIQGDDSGLDSVQAHAIQEDLLKILDEADASIDRDSAIQDLDSVIRSFEKEINVPVPAVQPELGYLLEASDDELGLPPAGQKGEIEAVYIAAQFSGIGGMKGSLGFEDEVVPNYCWLENLSSENESNGEGEEEVLALGGLFDHTDGTAELPPYRSETMYCL